MDLSPFKLDIDELIDEFVKSESTTLADMKRVWISRKFSYIYEASPSTNLAFFMQSLFAHTIGHMLRGASLYQRLGGLYCLYCLYETQPFKPPFKIYLSLGELKKLRHMVFNAREQGITIASAVLKKMLAKNVFLFGSVDLNEASVNETVCQATKLQNDCLQVAYEKLFADGRIEQFLHMDMNNEIELNKLKKISKDYAEAKRRALEEASKLVDVENIQHISEAGELIGDKVEKITENWDNEKDHFYQQTGMNKQPTQLEVPQPAQCENDLQQVEANNADDDFSRELEQHLFEEETFGKEEADESL